MRKIIILITAIIFIGCKNQKSSIAPPKPIHIDSLVTRSDSALLSINWRYFLVSYTSKEKNNSDVIYGNAWFSISDFPTKNEIDSMVYDGFDKKRNCYGHVIITSICEFKNIDDYLRFTNNYKADKKVIHKKGCCKTSTFYFK